MHRPINASHSAIGHSSKNRLIIIATMIIKFNRPFAISYRDENLRRAKGKGKERNGSNVISVLTVTAVIGRRFAYVIRSSTYKW